MNQQYLFYNKYYESVNGGYDELNKMLTGAIYRRSEENIPLTEQSFVLKTLYPGLLMGLGYSHEWGDIDGADKNGEIKLGFSFDYVLGLPYIPGSSVKGALRSCFEKYNSDIAAMLSCKAEDVKKLEEDIFGKNDDKSPGNDVFLDAFPVVPDPQDHVLGTDFITSHRSPLGPEYDGLTNPNPIRMLKVLPGVKFLFRFLLKDTVVEDVSLKASVKLELFKKLFMQYGVGAKTNVGYGRLEPTNDLQQTFVYLQPEIRAYAGQTENRNRDRDRTKNKAKESLTVGNGGVCIRCGAKTEKKKDGGYKTLCNKCFNEAPLCSKCGKKKVFWNLKKSQWFQTCYECK